MAIARVGSAAATTGTTPATSLSVAYSPTAGNAVIVFVGFSSNSVGLVVKDNLGNTLTAGPGWQFDYGFYQYPVPSGVTGYTISGVGSQNIGISVVEYSGSSGVVIGTTTNGSGASFSVTQDLGTGGDFSVCWMRCNNPPTVTAGTLVQSNTYNGNLHGNIVEATSASPGNVTVTETQTSTFWATVSFIVGGAGNARVSQTPVLVTKSGAPNARVSQVPVLVTKSGAPNARVSQDVVLVLISNVNLVLNAQTSDNLNNWQDAIVLLLLAALTENLSDNLNFWQDSITLNLSGAVTQQPRIWVTT